MRRLGHMLAAAVAAAAVLVPAGVAGTAQPTPKTTGDVSYTAYSNMTRNLVFNAIQTSSSCTASWSVAGAWVIDYTYNGVYAASYEGTLAQTGTALTGDFGYPVSGPPYQYTQAVTTGSVSGDTITLDNAYASPSDPAAAGSTMHMVGTIAADGSMSGTWNDTYPNGTGNRSGTWSTSSGAATKTIVTGCSAKGSAHYSDASGLWYDVQVQYAQVSGTDAWFAGPVTASNFGAEGNWLFVKVHDGGEPAALVDQVWGSFTGKTAAIAGVANMTSPADGPFAILGGNLQVH